MSCDKLRGLMSMAHTISYSNNRNYLFERDKSPSNLMSNTETQIWRNKLREYYA